jgi:F0F1-type ATP synthase membrane subunit c/vacuolar-type H+-ATPase subunit K
MIPMPRTTFAIIWGVLALAQLLYVAVPLPVKEKDPELLSTLALVLGFVAFSQALAIVALLRIRALGPIASGDLDLREQSGMAKLFTTLILTWILAESIGVYGLVLRMLGAESDLWSPFATRVKQDAALGHPTPRKVPLRNRSRAGEDTLGVAG